MESGGVESIETNPPLSAAAEALKRNTDCVYFLASPLTCKKGSECEYRHSEAARFNTRDCWYWFNGNCSNPKCSFRHPPLDGLFETPGTTTAGQVPLDSAASQTSTSVPAYAAAYNANKQNVPCYYFQMGHCVKGSRCPYMHGPQPTSNADPHQMPVTSAPPDQQSSKVARIPKGNVPELKGSNTTFDKETEKLPKSEEPAFRAESKPDSNFSPEDDGQVYRLKDELAGFVSNNVPLERVNAHALDRSWTPHSLDELVQNGRESDEFPGESSPGFDVLVDDQVEESEYFKNEDDYLRSPANGIGFVNEFEYQHHEYEPLRLDREQYKEMREYERYGGIHHEQHLASRRSVERPHLHERTLHRERSHDKMENSDLRHRLSKKRRIDDKRSSVAVDRSHRGNEYINRDRSHIRRSHEDDRHLPKESSISSRLRGRITMPASSSPDRPADSEGQMDKDWQRNRHRLSPVRRINHQVEHRGGVKRRLNEHSRSSTEQSGHHTGSRGDNDSLNFAGPKSLAELRSTKTSNSNGKTISRPSKDLMSARSEDPLSFEAPKPLSVILKRKREIASGTGSDSSSRDRDVLESRSEYSSVAEKGEVDSIQEPSKVASVDDDEEGLIAEEETDLPNDVFSAKKDMYESEDGLSNRMDGHGLDKYQQKSGDFDYEEDDGAEYKEDDFQTDYLDNDEEDEEDDFAKKVGVMLS